MTAEDPNAEQASSQAKSVEDASAEGAEQASVIEEFKSQGEIDPNLADSVAGEKQEEVKKPEIEEKKGEEGKLEKKEVPEKKEPEKKGKESVKDEHLSDEERDLQLFGEAKEEEKRNTDNGKDDLATAQDKFSAEFEKAYDANDESELAKIDKTIESKPKLVEKASESLFDQLHSKIKEGDQDSLQKLASLSDIAPNIANAVASKFWKGDVNDKKFFKSANDLFEEIGFNPEKKATPENKVESKTIEGQRETVLELELKLSDIAHEQGLKLPEFKKTDLYKQFISESAKFTRKGMKVDEFFGTVEKALLYETEKAKAKEEGAKEERQLRKASLSGPSGSGQDKSYSDAVGFSDEENMMLDDFGVDKKAVAARLAKNKK